MKVLVIDDEPAMLHLLEEFLGEYCGHEVVTRSNVDDGLDMFHSFNPDKIITDWNMPAGGGERLIKTVVAEGFNPQNIAVITGFGVSDLEALNNCYRALKLQIGMAFLKPLKFKEIQAFVEK